MSDDLKSAAIEQEPDYDALAASLPPKTAEEVLPRVLDAMELAQLEAAFKGMQMRMVRHVVNILGGPEQTPQSLPGMWIQVETEVRQTLDMPPPGTPAKPAKEPWEHVEDWLARLDHRKVEQFWLGNTNFAVPNSQAVKAGLLELLRSEVDEG